MKERYYAIKKKSDDQIASIRTADGKLEVLTGNKRIAALLEITEEGGLKVKEEGYQVMSFRDRNSLDWYILIYRDQLKEKRNEERRRILQ